MNEYGKITVSVIVPVHNSIERMPILIESLLAQTLENIEIIFVENSSTDGADKLLDEYAQQQQNIIVKHIPEQRSPSPGRNEGAKIARGEFVYFCDSDDYVYPDALQRMYDAAIISGADLIFGAVAYTYDEGETIFSRNLYKPGMSRIQYMNKQFCSVWEKLVKKTLLDRTPPFMTTAFEDVMWSYQVTALADKIIHVRKPVYLWYRRTGSISNTNYSIYAKTIAKSEEMLFQNLDSTFLEPVEFFMARRAKWQMEFRWYISDIIIATIKQFWDRYSSNKLVQNDENLYENLKYYAELPETSIPKKIYISGFRGNDISGTKEYFSKQSFREVCEVIVLSKQNCNVNENEIVKAAWENGDIELVEGYFAVKWIYEEGGFYCGQSMKLNAPLNCLLHWNTIFSFSSFKHFSDKIYGGKPGFDIYSAILETFLPDDLNKPDMMDDEVKNEIIHINEIDDDADDFDNEIKLLQVEDEIELDSCKLFVASEERREKEKYMDENNSLVDRFDKVLSGSFHVEMDGTTKRYKSGLYVFNPEVLMYNLFPQSLSNDPIMQIAWNKDDIDSNELGQVILSKNAINYYRELEEKKRQKNMSLRRHLAYLKKHKKELTWLLNRNTRIRRFLKKTPLYPIIIFARKIINRFMRMIQKLK